jgi:hypothetical protein
MAGGSDLVSRFDTSSIPVSIVIDRYGVISYWHVGSMTAASDFVGLFNKFIGDDYKQVLIDNPEMLNPKIEPTVQWTDSSASEIANAFNSGKLGVMDYYRLQNIQADTNMRNNLFGSKEDENPAVIESDNNESGDQE